MKKYSLILFGFLTLVLAGCQQDENVVIIQEEEILLKVTPYLVEFQEFSPKYNVLGTIKPQSETSLSSEVSGTVAQVLVKEGDKVSDGQRLLRFEIANNTINTNYESALSAYENARKTLELTRISAENDEIAAEIALEQAEIAYESAIKTDQSTEISVEEQIRAVESGVDSALINHQIAQNNIEDLKENLEKTKLDLLQSSENTVNSTFVVFDNAVSFSDSVLGVSDEYKNSNEAFRALLSVQDHRILVDAKNHFQITKTKFEALSDENIDFTSLEPAIDTIWATKEIGQMIRELLDLVDQVLENTVTDAFFTQTSLEALKGNIDSTRIGLENQLNALTSMSQTLTDYKIQSPQRLNSAILAEKAAAIQLAQAEANLKNLKAGLNVQTIGTSSQAEIAQKSLESANNALQNVRRKNEIGVQNVQSAADAAANALETAKLGLTKLTVNSPINGIITKSFEENGNTVNPGTPLFVISDIDTLVMEAEINTESASQIRVGQDVEVKIGDEQTATGKLNNIFPAANEATKRVRVDIMIDNKRRQIIANTIAEANIIGKPRSVLLIPLSSLVSKNPPTIFVIRPEERIVEKREVQLGPQNNGMIEVVEGIQAGDLIVADKVIGLEENDQVELIESVELVEPKGNSL